MIGVGGFDVNVEEIRVHARNVDTLRGRLGAVKAASAYITQDDQAYGLLCGWISAVLEGRHVRQDELLAQGEKNLSLVVDGLRRTADSYEAIDADASDRMSQMGGSLGGYRG